MNYVDTEKVRALSTKHGLKGRELSNRSGVCWQLIKTFYALPFRVCRDETVRKLSDVFKVSPDEITVGRDYILDQLENAEKKATAAGSAETAAIYQKRADKIRKVL